MQNWAVYYGSSMLPALARWSEHFPVSTMAEHHVLISLLQLKGDALHTEL